MTSDTLPAHLHEIGEIHHQLRDGSIPEYWTVECTCHNPDESGEGRSDVSDTTLELALEQFADRYLSENPEVIR